MPMTIPINALSRVAQRDQERPLTQFIGGQRIPANSQQATLESASSILMQQDGTSPAPPGASLNLSAFNVLSTLGVTLSGETKTYSLLGDQTDTQTLENISIFDPIYNVLTNTPVEATDKFSNNTDPFYELDDSPPSDEMRRREQIIEDELTPDVVSITAELITRNLESPTTPTLKQFVNNRDADY